MVEDVLRRPLLLPQDTFIVPVSALPEAVRARLGQVGDEFALTRPNAREPSKLIDRRAAGLIENFRQPRTIVQAVIAHSRAENLDPEATLEEALPLLRQLIASGLLVPEGLDGADPIEATLPAGAQVAGYRVVRCIQVFDDSELYQARDTAGSFIALKMARKGHLPAMRLKFARESNALRRLDGAAAPRLVAEGECDGRPFLAIAWVAGADVVTAVEELRSSDDRAGVSRLFKSIAQAYATLHTRGVLHGDVHPGNLLVDRTGNVILLDFGLAQVSGVDVDSRERGGVGFFIEPEWAARLLEDGTSPPVHARGEQFAVAALLYYLATRHHYVDFTLERGEMLRQIRDAAPLPFAARGVAPWPALEKTLVRALAKEPLARFPDMAAFAAELNEDPPQGAAFTIKHRDVRAALIASAVDELDVSSDLFRNGLPQPPLSSVNLGAAGIGYALYRLAVARDEPRLLALADAWLSKAEADAGSDRAFVNSGLELTPEIVGRVSPYHTSAGLHVVRALVDAASGNLLGCQRALTGFLQTVNQPCVERDLTLGRCGAVLAATILLESALDLEASLSDALKEAASLRIQNLWLEVDAFDRLETGRDWSNLGIAHGWAGLLYATQRYCTVTGASVPAAFTDRLEQLFECARPRGRGLEWPWRQSATHDRDYVAMPGWCNGAAGIAHVACFAHRQTGDARWLEYAEGAAWQAWEAGDGPINLCCGLAGRAYALLELHRATNDSQWLTRAHSLVDRTVKAAPSLRTPEHPPHSLFKGELGLAVLLGEIERPEIASMPMFGEEGRG
jgi:hypothetical protein